MIEFEETLRRENDDLWRMVSCCDFYICIYIPALQVRALQEERKNLQERVESLAEPQAAEVEQQQGLTSFNAASEPSCFS